jgi:hypothetical protein
MAQATAPPPQPAAPAPAPEKVDPAVSAASGEANETGDAKEKVERKERPYSVFRRISLDLNGDPAEIVETLRREHVVPGVNEDKPCYLLMRVGKASAFLPKPAIETVGELRDLNGSYEVIADGSRKTFDNVRTGRRVSIG